MTNTQCTQDMNKGQVSKRLPKFEFKIKVVAFKY